MTNWISPNEAMMTPMTMKDTFPRVFMFGGERPMTQDVIRTATGVVAFARVSFRLSGIRTEPGLTYLDHLNEGDGEVEVCEVTADKRQREEDTNGDNGSKVDSAVHGDFLP